MSLARRLGLTPERIRQIMHKVGVYEIEQERKAAERALRAAVAPNLCRSCGEPIIGRHGLTHYHAFCLREKNLPILRERANRRYHAGPGKIYQAAYQKAHPEAQRRNQRTYNRRVHPKAPCAWCGEPMPEGLARRHPECRRLAKNARVLRYYHEHKKASL